MKGISQIRSDQIIIRSDGCCAARSVCFEPGCARQKRKHRRDPPVFSFLVGPPCFVCFEADAAAFQAAAALDIQGSEHASWAYCGLPSTSDLTRARDFTSTSSSVCFRGQRVMIDWMPTTHKQTPIRGWSIEDTSYAGLSAVSLRPDCGELP
jgi:hypothetical protein